MHIRIPGLERCIHLLSFAEFQRTVAAGEVEAGDRRHWDLDSSRRFFQEYFRGACEIAALRQALACEVDDLTRLSDDDVVDAASRRLREGIWRVGRERDRRVETAAGAPGRAAAGAQVPVRRPAETSGPRRQAPAPVRARSPAGTVAAGMPPAAAEWTQDTDQVAFADVLRRAAQAATPFCEVCALRAEQAAAA